MHAIQAFYSVTISSSKCSNRGNVSYKCMRFLYKEKPSRGAIWIKFDVCFHPGNLYIKNVGDKVGGICYISELLLQNYVRFNASFS